MAFALLILLLALALVPVVLELLRTAPQVVQADKTLQLAQLAQGKTHYQWDGPEDGPVLVAVHGLTTSSYVFDALVPGLVAQGFRVLRYDHIGRGKSDPVTGFQDARFFVKHLAALLEDQQITGPVHLFGYSMGGSVITAYAATHPEQVKSMVLLASGGMDYAETPRERFARIVPALGDWWMEVYCRWKMRAALLAEKQDRIEVGGVVDRQLEEYERRGYLRAVLSSLRGILADRQAQAHKTIGKHDIPVLAIWGDVDDVIPITSMAKLREWNPAVKHAVIKGAGHGLVFTHTTDVLDELRRAF